MVASLAHGESPKAGDRSCLATETISAVDLPGGEVQMLRIFNGAVAAVHRSRIKYDQMLLMLQSHETKMTSGCWLICLDRRLLDQFTFTAWVSDSAVAGESVLAILTSRDKPNGCILKDSRPLHCPNICSMCQSWYLDAFDCICRWNSQ